MGLNDTPRANRLHIGIYGKRNSGKSSLINALTGQDIALVSNTPGTTADPVMKSMELHPVGPVVFIDTAGFDDEGKLGRLRVEKTKETLSKTDIIIMAIDDATLENADFSMEKTWLEEIKKRDIPVIIAINKWENIKGKIRYEDVEKLLREKLGEYPVVKVSAKEGTGIDSLRSALEKAVPEDFLRERILAGLIDEGGLALLVMPQDIQAPKGRLILPQVQTLRELLDSRCTAVTTTADGFERALGVLSRSPDLIITDSQCFKYVYDRKPEQSALTSFSVLFAAYKGDIEKFVKGASVLDNMTENSKVLIAEACTHVPLDEDIGRVKIPALLRKKFGEKIEIRNVCGNDFPGKKQLEDFDLIIHCGACMFNRKHVLSRIAQAEAAGVAITNYGITLAKLSGILDKIEIPEK
ncbi:MAG: [FeFe] hydrogenase H-cluster maturation GTPase HydF [Anaerovoracaceae bacterium]